VICNSIFISPLDRFSGGTGGTGGTPQDLARPRGDQHVGPVGPALAGLTLPWDRQSFMVVPPVSPTSPTEICRTACGTTGPTGHPAHHDGPLPRMKNVFVP
jgi:hypothetical protein